MAKNIHVQSAASAAADGKFDLLKNFALKGEIIDGQIFIHSRKEKGKSYLITDSKTAERAIYDEWTFSCIQVISYCA